MNCTKRNKGFTLIELLVVIAIIALLMGILAPALSKVKGKAQAVICTTRFSDVSKAVFLYANDFDDSITPAYVTSMEELNQQNDPKIGKSFIWIDRLAPYYSLKAWSATTSIMNGETLWTSPQIRCPTQEYLLDSYKQAVLNTVSFSISPKTGHTIYQYAANGVFGLNHYFSGRAGFSAFGPGLQDLNYRKLSRVRNPGRCPITADTAGEPYWGAWEEAGYTADSVPPSFATDMGGWYMIPQGPHPIAYTLGWYTPSGYQEVRGDHYRGPAPLHDKRINYLFSDGHADLKNNIWPWDDTEDPRPRTYIFHPRGEKGPMQYTF